MQDAPRTCRIDADGLELRLYERGDAGSPTVVLVHGYPDCAAVWNIVAEQLADRYHVVTYDVRGAGASGAPGDRAGYRLEHLVRDLGAVIDAVSPDEPVHLVGHDWGSIQGWEAVCDEHLQPRIASFTSISGPPLDHAARWSRRHAASPAGIRQARRSWYVLAFQVPELPEQAWRLIGPRFGRILRRIEGIEPAPDWPAPTLVADAANGVNLYRANVRDRLREPRELRTRVPVQLIVPTGDRFVTKALLEGLDEIAERLRRREVDAGHWVVRSRPADLARWIDAHARACTAP